MLGSPWSHPDYARLVQRQRVRGLRFALLVYDLIPIRRPEWCDRGLVRLFSSWFKEVLPLCDATFAISQCDGSRRGGLCTRKRNRSAGPCQDDPDWDRVRFGFAAR